MLRILRLQSAGGVITWARHCLRWGRGRPEYLSSPRKFPCTRQDP